MYISDYSDKLNYIELKDIVKEIANSLSILIERFEDRFTNTNINHTSYQTGNYWSSQDYYRNNSIGVWFINDSSNFVQYTFHRDANKNYIPSKYVCRHGLQKLADELKLRYGVIVEFRASYFPCNCNVVVSLKNLKDLDDSKDDSKNESIDLYDQTDNKETKRECAYQ